MTNTENKNYQVETAGYTRILSGLLDHLAKADLSGVELCIVLVIIRKTYGYHKTQDEISISQFHELTGRSRRHIIRALESLQNQKIIILVKKGASKKTSNLWKVNKYYKSWQLVTQKSLELVTQKSPVKIAPTSDVDVISTSDVDVTHKRYIKNNINTKKEVILNYNTNLTNKVVENPAQKARQFFTSDEAQIKTLDWLVGKGIPEGLARTELQKFIAYWTEPNKSGKKLRWEEQKFFELTRRLGTWFSKVKSFNQPKERQRKIWTLDQD